MQRASRLNAKQQAVVARPDVFAITSAARDLSGGVRATGPNGRLIVTPSPRGGTGVDALWEFIPTEEDSVFKIKSVQFGGFVTTASGVPEPGPLVINFGEGLSFRIQPDAEGTVNIKLPNDDLLWTLAQGSGEGTQVILEHSSGSWRQKFWKDARD